MENYLHAFEAAKRVEYSVKTSGQIGYQLLQKTSIRQAIESEVQIHPVEITTRDFPGCTPKQSWFVREYMKDLNATQAAIRSGYSEKTADRIGSELLGKTCIAAAIESEKSKRAERLPVD
jgi:phage terminase small subunit